MRGFLESWLRAVVCFVFGAIFSLVVFGVGYLIYLSSFISIWLACLLLFLICTAAIVVLKEITKPTPP